MASRIASRCSRRFFSSGSGKILSEEEKAAENIYIKKMEQERLAKAARKGPQAEETAAAGTGESVSDAKPSGPGSSIPNVSTDKYRNYAAVAGVVTALAGLAWYMKGSKKQEEVRD